MNTIIRSKTPHRGKRGVYRVKVIDTVRETVKEIGKGQITTELVLWSINSQLSDTDQYLTMAQVRYGIEMLMFVQKIATDRYRWEHESYDNSTME